MMYQARKYTVLSTDSNNTGVQVALEGGSSTTLTPVEAEHLAEALVGAARHSRVQRGQR